MDSFMSLFLFNKDIWLKHTWKHRNSGAKVYNNWTENLIESFYSKYNQPEARITVLKERCSKINHSGKTIKWVKENEETLCDFNLLLTILRIIKEAKKEKRKMLI